MQKFITTVFALIIAGTALAQSRFSSKEFSINGYRNPSVGVEFRIRQISLHAGYYPSNFEAGVTTDFFKAGTTVWFLPVGKKENPSSFYAGADYLRGLSFDYKQRNAVGVEAGFRWMIWKGLNLRVGAIMVNAAGQGPKFNPTSALSYSFFF